jgi:hypothetical protein
MHIHLVLMGGTPDKWEVPPSISDNIMPLYHLSLAPTLFSKVNHTLGGGVPPTEEWSSKGQNMHTSCTNQSIHAGLSG